MAYYWASDDLRCTNPKCKKHTSVGWGLQFLDQDNNEQRYCTPCYVKMCKQEEIKWERKQQKIQTSPQNQEPLQ